MRRMTALLALAAASLLPGCVYDPYTGTYLPCCSYYGYPYGYRYPPPYYYPYGYQPGPYGPPSQYQQPGGYPNPSMQPPGTPGAAAAPSRSDPLAQRFTTANVTHDRRLNRQQAESGTLFVATNFEAIDIDHTGYVTPPAIRASLAQRQADREQPGQPSDQ